MEKIKNIIILIVVFCGFICAYSYAAPVNQPPQDQKPLRSQPQTLQQPQVQKPSDQEPQKPMVLTLEDAIFLALRNNPDLKSAQLDRVTQKYDLIVEKWGFEPQYSLGASTNYQTDNYSGNGNNRFTDNQSVDIEPNLSVSDKTVYGTQFTLTPNVSYNIQQQEDENGNVGWHHSYTGPGVSLNITQPLIKGFGKDVVLADLRNAFNQEIINKLSLKEKYISTVNKIIQDYLNVIKAKQTLKVDQASLKENQITLSNTKKRIAAGRAAKYELYQTESSIAQQQLTISNNIENIRQARFTLLNDIGLDIDANVIIPEKIDYQVIINRLTGDEPLPDLETSKNLALKNNIDYQTAGITLNTTKRELITAKDQQKWQLNLTATGSTSYNNPAKTSQNGISPLIPIEPVKFRNYRANGDNDDDDDINGDNKKFNNSVSAELDLDIPVHDLNNRQALLSARIGLEQAEIAYAEQKRQLEMDIENSRFQVIDNKKQIDLAKDALKLQRKSLQMTKIKYRAGLVPIYELLDEQKKLADAEQEIVNTEIEYINSLIDFDEKLATTLDKWGITIKY